MASSLNTLLRLLNDRLSANARLLGTMDAGGAEHTACVHRQQDVFNRALQSMPSMPEDVAVSLCEAVARVGWPTHEEQRAAIMAHVLPASAELRLAGVPFGLRTKQQDFFFLEHHLPNRIWMADSDMFMSASCQFATVELGLQNPSEPTVQKFVALILLATKGLAAALATSWAERRQLIDTVKARLKIHRHQRPFEWIDTLPEDQVTFRSLFPG